MKKILIIFLCGILSVFSACSQKTNSPIDSQHVESSNPSISAETEKTIKWPEITENGVDEELLIQNIDIDILEKVAAELQALCDEMVEEERKNPEILLTEGFPRVFKKERYKEVIDMGEVAMKPLYLIIYKSDNCGMYEYICARALYDLSGSDFDWINSKDFLEKFNSTILKSRQQ